MKELLQNRRMQNGTDQSFARKHLSKQKVCCLRHLHILAHYDPSLPVHLAGDASVLRCMGLGWLYHIYFPIEIRDRLRLLCLH